MATQARNLEVILSIICLLGTCHAQYKKWKHNTNFENPKNWNVGRVPCKNDRVRMPESLPPVYVQTNTTVLELVLPNNGELVIGPYSSISFMSAADNDAHCQGQDVTFTRTDPYSWLDQNSWCTATDAEGDCKASQPKLLETEAVPCKYEQARFPKKNSFLVDLDGGVDIYIGSLVYQGQSYSTGTFRDFLASDTGKLTFKRRTGGSPTTISINGFVGCNDDTGCVCGNDQGAIMDKICGIANKDCPRPSCGGTLKPQGGCCDMCGTILKLDYKSSFKINDLRYMIQGDYIDAKPENKDVKLVVSKVTGGSIQVVLIDGGEGNKANNVGRAVAKALNDDIKGRQKYGVTGLQVQYSSVTATPEARKGLTGGSIAGIILSILLVLALVGLAVFCLMDRRRLRQQLDRMYSLRRRFTRFGKEDEVELGAPGFTGPVTFDARPQGFENPMYGSPVQLGVHMPPTSAVPPGPPLDSAAASIGAMGADSGFVNPMYGQGAIQEIETHEGAGFVNPVYSAKAEPGLRINPVFSMDDDQDGESKI